MKIQKNQENRTPETDPTWAVIHVSESGRKIAGAYPDKVFGKKKRTSSRQLFEKGVFS